jgi:hypothetical protein
MWRRPESAAPYDCDTDLGRGSDFRLFYVWGRPSSSRARALDPGGLPRHREGSCSFLFEGVLDLI